MGIVCVSSVDRSKPLPIANPGTGLWATVPYPRVAVSNLLYYNRVFDRRTGISRVEGLIRVCPVDCFSWLGFSSWIILSESAQNASKHVIRSGTTDVFGLPGRVACDSMYPAMIRIALFLATNGAILVLISIVCKIFGFQGILAENGVDLNLSCHF